MVGWTNDLGICVVAKNFYDSLSDEHKQIIDECTKEMIDKERELYTASEDECLELLKERHRNHRAGSRTIYRGSPERI